MQLLCAHAKRAGDNTSGRIIIQRVGEDCADSSYGDKLTLDNATSLWHLQPADLPSLGAKYCTYWTCCMYLQYLLYLAVQNGID